MSEWVLPYKDESVPAAAKFQRYEKEGAKTCGAKRDGMKCYLDRIHSEFSNHVHRSPDGTLVTFEIEQEE